MSSPEYDDYGRKIKKPRPKKDKQSKTDKDETVQVVHIDIPAVPPPTSVIDEPKEPQSKSKSSKRKRKVDTSDGDGGSHAVQNAEKRVDSSADTTVDAPKPRSKMQRLFGSVATARTPTADLSTAKATSTTISQNWPTTKTAITTIAPVVDTTTTALLEPTTVSTAVNTASTPILPVKQQEQWQYFPACTQAPPPVLNLVGCSNAPNALDMINIGFYTHIHRLLLDLLYNSDYGYQQAALLSHPRYRDIFCEQCIISNTRLMVQSGHALSDLVNKWTESDGFPICTHHNNPRLTYLQTTTTTARQPCQDTTTLSAKSKESHQVDPQKVAPVPLPHQRHQQQQQQPSAVDEHHHHHDATFVLAMVNYLYLRLQQPCIDSVPTTTQQSTEKPKTTMALIDAILSSADTNPTMKSPPYQRYQKEPNRAPQELYSFNQNLPKKVGKLPQLSPVERNEVTQQKWKIFYTQDPLFTIHAELTRRTVDPEEWKIINT